MKGVWCAFTLGWVGRRRGLWGGAAVGGLSARLRRRRWRAARRRRRVQRAASLDLRPRRAEYPSQKLAAEYETRARPILEAYMARGLITDEELATGRTLGTDRHILADQLQALAESLLTY